MKISIITVVFNNKNTITDAINSVLCQTYQDIEYIIIDGGSNDGTVEVIQSYGEKVNICISEPDEGLYDAMNKGILLSTGDVIGILNSDDFYIDEFVIEKIANKFEKEGVDSIFADLVYVKPDDLNKNIRYYDSSNSFPDRFKYALFPAHPTFFVKKWVYERYGLYKTDYKISADFDIMVRFLYTHRISFAYLKEPIIKMRVGGVSTSFSSIWINNIEQLRVCKENGIKTNIFNIVLKYPYKIMGFFKR
jgi:glycosyltransferase involved in cell wall biosynthesis